MKKLLLIFISLLLIVPLLAQDRNDAVVYIQSDKSIPFYVKMEGQMMERYSKYYVILNSLASGPLHLEILFQQNQYPAQKFILNVAPSAQRSLVLQKDSDNKFALYDVNYGIYLQAGNKLTDDIAGSANVAPIAANDNSNARLEGLANDKTVEVDAPSKEPIKSVTKVKKDKQSKIEKEDEVVPFVTNSNSNKEITTAQSSSVSKSERKSKQRNKEDQDQDRFLDFEFDKTDKENRTTASNNSSLNNSITCSEAASEAQFNQFVTSVSSAEDEETNLAVIRKNAKNYCFSTDQIHIIANKFVSQSSRYEVTRLLKPRAVDKENYSVLSSLFNTNYLKERFLNEVVGR